MYQIYFHNASVTNVNSFRAFVNYAFCVCLQFSRFSFTQKKSYTLMFQELNKDAERVNCIAALHALVLRPYLERGVEPVHPQPLSFVALHPADVLLARGQVAGLLPPVVVVAAAVLLLLRRGCGRRGRCAAVLASFSSPALGRSGRHHYGIVVEAPVEGVLLLGQVHGHGCAQDQRKKRLHQLELLSECYFFFHGLSTKTPVKSDRRLPGV